MQKIHESDSLPRKVDATLPLGAALYIYGEYYPDDTFESSLSRPFQQHLRELTQVSK